MDQNTLQKYDEFLDGICNELYKEFVQTKYLNADEETCLVCTIEDWFDKNKTRHLSSMFQVSKDHPQDVAHLLQFLENQFKVYQLMTSKLLEYHEELFEDAETTE